MHLAQLKIEPIQQPDKIIQYWKKEKFAVACIVLFGLGFNGASVLSPIFQGRLIDALLRGDTPSAVTMQALTFVLLVGGIQLMRYFKRFYIRRFANGTSATMRLMIYNNILHKSAEELDRESTGDLMARALSDVDLCVEGMRKFTTEIFDTGVLMAAYLISMLFYDVRITVLAGLFIPLAMVLAEKLKTIIYRYSVAYRRKSSEITSLVYEAVDNAMLYRANGMEAQNRGRYARELEDLQDKAIKANLLENSMQPVYNVIAMLGVILVITLGGRKVISGGWTVGAFSAYLTMFAALAVKASKAAKLFNSVQKSQVSWQRIKPYLTEYQTKVPIPDRVQIQTPNSPNPDRVRNRTHLSVENLSFHYPGSEEPVIENVNFSAAQGEIVGVTGSIATGKSTLGLSLLGFYPYIGSIRIDGHELRDLTELERSRMIAYLGHKPQLLSDTLFENVTLGEPQDITGVLQDVCFDTDLAAMPDGVQTRVGNSGVRLSGGQQARVALARTLLDRRKIIILDDPFSAVDMKTEEMIIANLKAHYKDSLIILISHRLAIFNQVDRIVLLHADKTVEVGTHTELLHRSEQYATICSLQSQTGDDLDEA